MISDIRVDLSDIKRILNNAISENKQLIDSDESTVLKELYRNNKSQITLDTNELYSYKNIFKDIYSEKCKKLAKYCSMDEATFNKVAVSALESQGRLFSSGVLITLIKHLEMEQALFNEDNQVAICILITLHIHLCNCYYYTVDEESLNSLFNNAIFLFLSNKDYCNGFKNKNTETIAIINSVKRLENKYGIEYEIINGEIVLSDETHKTIQRIIEKRISVLGGIAFLNYLYDRCINPKYNSTIDRFLIHRNKKQFALKIDELRIPYNYLIQLGVKYINIKESVVLTRTGFENSFCEIIENSRDYLNVLNLQSYFVLSDMIWDFRSIPTHLEKNIYFEKLYTPTQYRPDFVLEFLRKVYEPLYEDGMIKEYSFNDYMKFCQVILNEKRRCLLYLFSELKHLTNIRKKALQSILSDISYSCNEINCKFDSFLSETNYYQKPLIKRTDNTYFLFSSYFNGFAFCEVIYRKLKSLKYDIINRLKGPQIECMIKSFFDSKGFSYHYGKYQINKSTINECDLVIENDKLIVFFEIKNRPLPVTFEQGDDVKTLRCLAEGMIKAQTQCLKHMCYLKSNGSINIENSVDDKNIQYQLKWNNRRIICVSVCAQEYLFLTNKNFSEKFLQSLLVSTYHADDKNRENELQKLNDLSNELNGIITKMYKPGIDLSQIFFDTLFRTAQQLFAMLSVSESLDEFIHNLTEPIYVMDGSEDVYCQLVSSINMANYN